VAGLGKATAGHQFDLCEQVDDESPAPGLETIGAGFFGLDELPPLSTGRVIYSDIEAAVSSAGRRREPAAFD